MKPLHNFRRALRPIPVKLRVIPLQLSGSHTIVGTFTSAAQRGRYRNWLLAHFRIEGYEGTQSRKLWDWKLSHAKGSISQCLQSAAMNTVSVEGASHCVVGNSMAGKVQRATKLSSPQRAACNRFNMNHLRTIEFQKLQQGLERGSGPGGLPCPPSQKSC